MSTKKSAAPVLKHFEVPEDTKGNFKAKCKHCEDEMSVCSKATKNLHKHLKRNAILEIDFFFLSY